MFYIKIINHENDIAFRLLKNMTENLFEGREIDYYYYYYCIGLFI